MGSSPSRDDAGDGVDEMKRTGPGEMDVKRISNPSAIRDVLNQEVSHLDIMSVIFD